MISHRNIPQAKEDNMIRIASAEFTETPEERPYGIDAGFRDPSGNSVRLTQLAEVLA